MPSGLFKQEQGHWLFAGPTPPIFKGYGGDHAELLVRYVLELTPQEQQRLIQMSGGKLNTASAKSAPSELQGKSHKADPRPGKTLVGMLLKAH